ncbi:hypothetical protein O181_014198 [Austropuccinia psidii MF-1]|uniref:Uncharacterized protein n=1 Tax=Austropuccinia psidii MF-1 TaxID=1389203 RepID=A0A9Q3C041_9BASI|nr:hypothetical protein [Austropuccinia psidii MF-1]
MNPKSSIGSLLVDQILPSNPNQNCSGSLATVTWRFMPWLSPLRLLLDLVAWSPSPVCSRGPSMMASQLSPLETSSEMIDRFIPFTTTCFVVWVISNFSAIAGLESHSTASRRSLVARLG